MWLRRLLVVPLVLGLFALGAYVYFFNDPQPDQRMACYYGAYDLADARVVVVSPTSGIQNLRTVYMDGTTELLKPIGKDANGVSSTFSRSAGWTGETLPRGNQVTFGPCEQGVIAIESRGQGAVEGRRMTFDVTDVTFESHGLKLAGRLVMPRLEGTVPVAVFVHGSEDYSAILFSRFQYLLPAAGIGAFVYDKRGTGNSEGRYSQDFHLLADDAAAALTKAREMTAGLASEVGFFGGSQAGWIEPLAATKAKADFVLVGFGLVESPLAEDRDEVFDDLRTAGYGDDVIAKAREITDATAQVMSSRFRQGFDRLDAVRAKYSNEPWYPKVEGEFTGDFLRYPNWMLQIVGPWFDQGTSWDYDPLPALNAYQGPHLWILAGRDSSAPPENTLRILREVQATHPNLDIVMFPTADHGITEFVEKDGQRTDVRFSEGYFQLIVDWILFKDPHAKGQGPIIYDGGLTAPEPTPTSVPVATP